MQHPHDPPTVRDRARVRRALMVIARVVVVVLALAFFFIGAARAQEVKDTFRIKYVAEGRRLY